MRDINFSCYQIVIDNYRNLEFNDLKKVKMNSSIFHTNDDTAYDLTFDYIPPDKYFWVYTKYGRANPCPSAILDTNLSKYTENTRTKEKIEMGSQIFGLYDFQNKVFYLSNSQHRNTLQYLLSQEFGLNFYIKSIFVDIEEYQKIIKNLKSIKFTSFHNLFTYKNQLNTALVDLLGNNQPIDFTLEINCGYTGENKIPIIRNLKKMYDNKEIKELVIKGENEEKFEQIFKAGVLNKKLTIYADRNSEGLFDPQEIQGLLLNKIE